MGLLKAEQSLATLKIQIIAWNNSENKRRGLENTEGPLVSMWSQICDNFKRLII